MGTVMPKPFKIGDTYYLRRHVPRDVAQAAKGRRVSLVVGGQASLVTIGSALKVSLRTKDPKEAKARQTLVLADAERLWEGLRGGPSTLNHQQSLALAGELCVAFVEGRARP